MPKHQRDSRKSRQGGEKPYESGEVREEKQQHRNRQRGGGSKRNSHSNKGKKTRKKR